MSIVMLPSAGCGPRRDPKNVGATLSEILTTPYCHLLNVAQEETLKM